MALYDLETQLPRTSSGVVVCIPLYGAHDHFTRCLRSVLRHTPQDVPILIADDCGPDPASRAWVASLEDEGVLAHTVHWRRNPVNLGFVGNVNLAFDSAEPNDVVILNSDCVVADGWLDGLAYAAYADTTVATATALTNNGTILSVPHRNRAMPSLPQELTFDEAARRVRERSRRLSPRIHTAIGHCAYIRRSALDLVGGFDPAFSPAYGEEVDFSQRCVVAGLSHVAADSVLVLHHGGGSLHVDGEKNPVQAQHERLLRERYPYYAAEVRRIESSRTGALDRALRTARRAMIGPSLTIDARCLTPVLTGTQIHTLELIGAVWRTQTTQLRVVVPPDLGDYAQHTLEQMPGITILRASSCASGVSKSDVVHRPYQVSTPDDLDLLRALGERVVITHQDLIAYRNPGYFSSWSQWEDYRRITRLALEIADLVVFFSSHARNDACAEDIVAPERTRVVAIGVDHRLGSLRPAPAIPPQVDDMPAPFLLCLGVDYRHKNRLFALRVLEALLEDHGWDGGLVLAGPHAAHGSSLGQEAQWLSARPHVEARVHTLPAVDEATKAWLYSNAALVLYPTTYEGFGLVPFEAADFGTPCAFAPITALSEVLADVSPLLVPWRAAESARRVATVLEDGQRRSEYVESIRRAAGRLTWSETGRRMLDVYEDAAGLPSRESAWLADDALAAEARLGEWAGRYWDLREQIGKTGLSLVGPDAPLLPEPAQRAIAALARRRATRKPLLASLEALHSVSRRVPRDGD